MYSVRFNAILAISLSSLFVSACVVPTKAARPTQAASPTGKEDNSYRPNPDSYPQVIDFFPQAKVPTSVPLSVAKDCNIVRQDFVFSPASLASAYEGIANQISGWGVRYVRSCPADRTYVLMRWQETNGLPVTGVITQVDIDKTDEIFKSAKEKWLVATKPQRDKVEQKKAAAAQKEEEIAYRSFFGVPLGESLDYYRKNYSKCYKGCVGMGNDILSTKVWRGDGNTIFDTVSYVVLPKELVPAWLVIGSVDSVWMNDRKIPFLPIPEKWAETRTRLHGVSFEVYKEAAVEAFIEKYGKPARSQEIRTSSERRSGGGIGNPVKAERLSERASIYIWQNTAVIAELACFSDNKCDGVVVTKEYWPTFTQQRKQGGGKL